MPLREVSDINARYEFPDIFTCFDYCTKLIDEFRLDSVQEIMNHPAFKAAFTGIAKGLPDLERVVARVHAKNCRVKDFLKVLGVSLSFLKSMDIILFFKFTGFQKAQ
jgi:DNA mismatch repair protein MSH6